MWCRCVGACVLGGGADRQGMIVMVQLLEWEDVVQVCGVWVWCVSRCAWCMGGVRMCGLDVFGCGGVGVGVCLGAARAGKEWWLWCRRGAGRCRRVAARTGRVWFVYGAVCRGRGMPRHQRTGGSCGPCQHSAPMVRPGRGPAARAPCSLAWGLAAGGPTALASTLPCCAALCCAQVEMLSALPVRCPITLDERPFCPQVWPPG